MKAIPAIDLLDGRVVRLRKGNYEEVTVYNENPLEEAAVFADAGFDRIHVVDLNGAREGRFANLPIVGEIIRRTGLSVQSGGGVRSAADARKLFEAGVSRVICSSLAVKSPEQWYELLEEDPDRAILGMDLKDGRVAYGGWEETTGQQIGEFLAPMLERGLRHILCTDISRDGTLEGPNVPLYRRLQERYPGISFIASGGVSSADDLEALREAGLPAVVVGRAYYEGLISLRQMKGFSD